MPVWRDLFHTVYLRTINVIFQVTKTSEQRSRESLCNVRPVVQLVTYVVGRNIFSSGYIFLIDSIFLLLLKKNS